MTTVVGVRFEPVYRDIVSKAKDGDVFVELGTFLGHSALLMGELIKESGKDIHLYTVDYFNFWREKSPEWVITNNVTGLTHFSIDDALKRIEPVMDVVTVVNQNSWEPIKGLNWCDFCWIDASHEYEDVKKDIEYWLPRSKIIGGDDYGWTGVRQAVDELIVGGERGHFWMLDPNPYYDQTLLHLPKVEA